MTSLVSAVSALIGTFVPSSNGIASLDFPWIVAAIFFLMCCWFLFKIVLALIRR